MITKSLRDKTLKSIEGIFRAAGRVAHGKIKHQRTNRKTVPVTFKKR
jgi:hypothetical protein